MLGVGAADGGVQFRLLWLRRPAYPVSGGGYDGLPLVAGNTVPDRGGYASGLVIHPPDGAVVGFVFAQRLVDEVVEFRAHGEGIYGRQWRVVNIGFSCPGFGSRLFEQRPDYYASFEK